MKTALQKIIKQSRFIFLLILTFPLVTNRVMAQNVVGTSAIPPRVEISAKPGDVKSEVIKIRNEANNDQNFTTSVADFIVNDSKGTPIKIEAGSNLDNRWAASSWIQVSESKFKLKGGETKALSLVIMVPKDALPGGHYAMILHSPDNQKTLSSSGSSIQTQVGTLVYITVAGDIKENASVNKFSAPKFLEFGPVNFDTTIKNLSDIHIKPVGSITVKNLLGLKTGKLDLADTNIFPYTSRDFTNKLDKKWLFGRYTANLNAIYGPSGKTIAATLVFWVIPWRLLILLVALIAIIATVIILNKNKPEIDSSEEKVEELEKELEDLKKKYKD
ncbi:MAG: hypothetical protein WCG91_03925 [Candidatus Shapirobacteria bacterium]